MQALLAWAIQLGFIFVKVSAFIHFTFISLITTFVLPVILKSFLIILLWLEERTQVRIHP
jgi:hypothetical protein